MKKSILFTVLVFNFYLLKSQVLDVSNPEVQAALASSNIESSPLSNFFQKRTPMMDILFRLIKDDDGIERHYVGAQIGSAYEYKDFKQAKLFFEKEEIGDVYYRLNAYNNEVEMKKSLLKEEKQLSLVKTEKVKLILKDGNTLQYSELTTNQGNLVKGYFTTVYTGSKIKLLRKLNLKFTEPKPAENSMVNATPSRFTKYIKYYYKESDTGKIVEIPSKKSKLLKSFNGTEYSEELKSYLKEQKIDLKNEQDVIELIKSIDDNEA